MSSSGADRPPEFSQLLREIDTVVSTSEQRHRSELQTLRQKAVDSSSQINSLERRLQSQTQHNGTLQSEILQLQRQLRQYSGVSEQLEDLRAQSEQLRQTHEQSKAKHKRHMQRAKDRHAQLEAENASKTTELESARQNLQSARTQLATAAADERSCKEELSSVRQRTNSLAEKCSLLRQQLEQCEADRTSLQCQAQETSQKYQNHISELESKVHTLRMTSTSNLELTKSSLDKAQTQVQHLTEENLSLRRQVTKTNGELELLNVNYACLKDELSAIKEDLLHAQHTEKRDASRVAELEHKLLQKDDVVRAFEESQERSSSAELNRLRQEVDNLSRRLQRAGSAENELQSKISRLGERTESCQHDNNALKQDLANTRCECERYRNLYQEMQSKESSIAEERSEAQRTRLEVLQLQSRLSAREEESRRWTEQVRTTEEQLRKTMDSRDSCQAQLKVANAQLDELRLQNASLRSSLHTLGTKPAPSSGLDQRPSQSKGMPTSASGGSAAAATDHQRMAAGDTIYLNVTSPTRVLSHGSTGDRTGYEVSVTAPVSYSTDLPHLQNAVPPAAAAAVAVLAPASQPQAAYSLLSRQNFLSTATAASTGPVQSMPPARVATEPRFTTGEDSIRTIPADSELLSATPSTISKFSDMGSVSSLTTSDSEPSTSRHANIETQTTAAAIAENPYLTPADRRSEECRSGHVEAARMPSHGLANGGHDDGDVTSSFTASTAQLLDYSSTSGDLSRHTGISTDTAVASGGTSTQAQATSAQPAGHSGPIPMMSEEFMHDFLTDHMSVLQTRIEETIEKLGLTKEAT